MHMGNSEKEEVGLDQRGRQGQIMLHVHAKLLLSCPTLCDPIDSSPSGSSVHRISQARILGVGCHALL